MADTPIPTRVPDLLGVLISLLTLSTSVVALRIYCRAVVLKKFGLDDWLIIAAVVVNCMYTAVSILGTQRGYGKHIYNVDPKEHEGLLKLAWISGIASSLNPCMAKLSILALQHRLALERIHRIIIKVIGCIMIGYTAMLILLNIFMCAPIKKAWDIESYPGGCAVRLTHILASQAACNVATDVIIYCMPLPIIYKLNMPRRDKITITIVLLFGATAVIASAIRLERLTQFGWQTYDFTWESADSGIWTIIECNLALISCSLFAVRQLVLQRAKHSKLSLQHEMIAGAKTTIGGRGVGREIGGRIGGGLRPHGDDTSDDDGAHAGSTERIVASTSAMV